MSKLKIFSICLILAVSLSLVSTAMAYDGSDSDVAAASSLTNSVYLYYKNLGGSDRTPVNYDSSVTVDAIYGVLWADTYSADPDIGNSNQASPGETTTFTYWISNAGNAACSYVLNVQEFSVYSSVPGGFTFVVGNATNDSITSGAGNLGANAGETVTIASGLAEDGDGTFAIKVFVPSNANDADSLLFTVTVADMYETAASRTYSSRDGRYYSAIAGETFGGKAIITDYDDGDSPLLTVGGPIMYVNKVMYSTAPLDYVSLGGGAGDYVPGATITVNIIYDNDGSGTAANVILVDTVPTGLAFVTSSMDSDPNGNVIGDSYYISGTWENASALSAGGVDDSVTAIKFTIGAAGTGRVAADNGGDASGSAQDDNGTDCGRITFALYIK